MRLRGPRLRRPSGDFAQDDQGGSEAHRPDLKRLLGPPARDVDRRRAGIVITASGAQRRPVAAAVRRPRRPRGPAHDRSPRARTTRARSAASRSIAQTCGPQRCVERCRACATGPRSRRSIRADTAAPPDSSRSAPPGSLDRGESLDGGPVVDHRGKGVRDAGGDHRQCGTAIASAAASSTTVARDSVPRVVTSSDPGFPLSTSSATAWSACPIRAPDLESDARLFARTHRRVSTTGQLWRDRATTDRLARSKPRHGDSAGVGRDASEQAPPVRVVCVDRRPCRRTS